MIGERRLAPSTYDVLINNLADNNRNSNIVFLISVFTNNSKA